MLSLMLWGLAALGLVVLVPLFLTIRYTPAIRRVFEDRPVMLPVREQPDPDVESLRFRTSDGHELVGSLLPARTDDRAGLVVFGHEFLGDRWSAQTYLDFLRDEGFDVFTFDFRNHGESDTDSSYDPLQWVSEFEVRDLNAAIDFIQSRDERDPAGVALMGISRGGGAAVCVAAERPDVWAVISDGAFPTHGTVVAYIHRWAEIFVAWPFLVRITPSWIYSAVAWMAQHRLERRLHREFPSLERAVERISPRPWLQIHGGRDTYIGTDIADDLYRRAKTPKAQWIVPKAKHNRCHEVDPDRYRQTISDFLRRYAPRRPLTTPHIAPVVREAGIVLPRPILTPGRPSLVGQRLSARPIDGPGLAP